MLTLKDLFLSKKENLKSNLLSAKDLTTFIEYFINGLNDLLKPENDYMKSLKSGEIKIVNELLVCYKNNYSNILNYLSSRSPRVEKQVDASPYKTEPKSNYELLIGAGSGTLSGALSGGILGGVGGAAIGTLVGFVVKENNSKKIKNETLASVRAENDIDVYIPDFIINETINDLERYLAFIDDIVENRRSDKQQLESQHLKSDVPVASLEILKAIQSLISINYDEDNLTPKYTSLGLKRLISVLQVNGIEIVKYEEVDGFNIEVPNLFDIEYAVDVDRTTIETISPAFVQNNVVLLKGRVTIPKNNQI